MGMEPENQVEQPNFAEIIEVERADDSLSTILSANLLEIARSLSLSNKYVLDASKGAAPAEPPEFREELEPVRYLAMDPEQTRVSSYPSLTADILISLSRHEQAIDILTKNIDPLLVNYEPAKLNYGLQHFVEKDANRIVNGLNDTKELVHFASKSPETKDRDFEGSLTDIITMAVITSVNERNVALGREGDEFPLKNYFPEYFATDSKLTTASVSAPTPSAQINTEISASIKDAAVLAKNAFESSSEGIPASAQRGNDSEKTNTNQLDSRKAQMAVE